MTRVAVAHGRPGPRDTRAAARKEQIVLRVGDEAAVERAARFGEVNLRGLLTFSLSRLAVSPPPGKSPALVPLSATTMVLLSSVVKMCPRMPSSAQPKESDCGRRGADRQR